MACPPCSVLATVAPSSRFVGNQFRLLLTLAPTSWCRRARPRGGDGVCHGPGHDPARLLKVAVWVERSVRRMVLHFPVSFPWQPTWR